MQTDEKLQSDRLKALVLRPMYWRTITAVVSTLCYLWIYLQILRNTLTADEYKQ